VAPECGNAKSLASADMEHSSVMIRQKQSEQTPAKPGAEKPQSKPQDVKEIGGRMGPEPTRYGDWEVDGRDVGSVPSRFFENCA
jgi:hypothetical protein